MGGEEITLYGAFWCPDCHRSRQFLGEHQIPYRFVDIDADSEGEQFVVEANEGKRRIPTIVLNDGSTLTNPTNAELAAQLGLKTTAQRRHYDLVVVGAGPAGLTAALYAAREGIETLLVERAAIGGQAATTMHLDNVPGFPEGITGAELARRLRLQVERFGVELLQAHEVSELCTRGSYRCVRVEAGVEYSARAVLLATGSRYRRLGVPGEEEFFGAGVHYCATCDGPFYKGRAVGVVGGGNSAAEESLFLTKFVERVVLLVRGDALRASRVVQEKVLEHPSVEVCFRTSVEKFLGERSRLRAIVVRDAASEQCRELELPGVFVFVGQEPNTAFLSASPIRTDARGFVVTGHALVHGAPSPSEFSGREPAALETSVPGIFAAGDVRAGSTKQVASAAGEGAAAALMIRSFLGGS